jgi:hypothetical protein
MLMLVLTLVLMVRFVPVAPAQTLLTTPTAISATNVAFDNQAIVVSGTTLTIEGTHPFLSLVLTNGAILTHPGNTLVPPHLILAGDFVVATGSVVDLTGRGFPAGQGPGAGPTVSCCAAGGSHGGAGGRAEAGTFGPTHGSPFQPISHGSGGGTAANYGAGGAGGGALRITALGEVCIDGRFEADGTPGLRYAGGGAGGSLWIEARRLTGSGSISANGGLGEERGGGGGGGRIALHLDTYDFNGSLTACGAGSGDGGTVGGAGTIHHRLAGEPLGTLVVDNCGTLGGTTDLDDGTRLEAHLQVRRGGTLAHRFGQGPATFEITGDLRVESDGAVSVNGRGHPTSQGPGSTRPIPCCTSGGSHGGTGGVGRDGARAGTTHGSVFEPYQAGSGGGRAANYGLGGSGGGALKLIVHGVLRNDGRIEANGTDGGSYAGGGAGGSLWIVAPALAGAGWFTATGGNGFPDGGGGGGGGRIALHYEQDGFSGRILVNGGEGTQAGGSGTVYRKPRTAPRGLVVLDNAGMTNGITEVDRDFTLAADLRIRGGAVLGTRFDTRLSTFRLLGDVTVETNGLISASGRGHPRGTGPGSGLRSSCCTAGASHAGSGGRGRDGANPGVNYGSIPQPTDPGSGAPDTFNYGDGGDGGGALRLIVEGTLRVDGRVESDGTGGGSYAGGGSGGSVWISGPRITGTGTFSVAGGNGWPDGGGGGGGGRLAIHTAQNTFTGSLALQGGTGSHNGGGGTAHLRLDGATTGQVILDNGGLPNGFTEVDPRFSLPDDLILRNGAILAPRPGERRWFLHFPGNVHIQAGGSISATGRGFPGGQGEGTSDPVPAYSAGGSHGGRGGSANNNRASTTHGDWFQPDTPGSGAGNTTSYGLGGPGGGAIRLVVDGELRVDGRLEADGGVGGNYGGGGAGGSLLVTAASLTGSGRISAMGGEASRDATGGGGGGGGRIALYYDAFDEALLDQMTAAGGNGLQQGGAGTIFLKASSNPGGDLIVDRSPVDTDTAPTEFWGSIQIPGSMRIRSGAIVSHPQGHPFHLGVRGDLTIASGAEVNLDGQGFPAGTGPGPGSDQAGAGHGGAGGNPRTGPPGGLAYGNAEEPMDPGSGAGNRPGGGAARFSVQGTLRLDGLITANASSSTTGGGAAGGSLRIHASRITGRGFVLADGGNGANTSNTGGGAGGRISILHHGTPLPTNQVSAAGGSGWQAGAHGTRILQTLPDIEPPRVLAAIPSPSMTEVAILFSDVLDWRTAEDPARYALTDSAAVLSATLQTDLTTVILTTSPLIGGTAYTVNVNGVSNGLGVPVPPASASAAFNTLGTLRGLARQEVFHDIQGSSLSHLYANPRWPVAPDLDRDVTRLAPNRDDIDGDHLAARITGYLIPDQTGWHRFFMTSDDNGVFYLSEDHSPANLRPVAAEPLQGFPGEWTGSTRPTVTTSRGSPPANISTPLWLQAGRHYWFDARFKEGTSTEHLSVTWQAPGDAAPLPNEGTRLTGDRIARPASSLGPRILAQPVGGEHRIGATVTLQVQAAGTGTLRFQWYRDGTPLSGETASTLLLPNLSPASFGRYRARVTDSVGAVDSSVAFIQRAIPPEPGFVQPPLAATAPLGSGVVLSAVAEGMEPLEYQWRLNGQEIPGANGPTLYIPAMRRADAGAYTLVVSNPLGLLESPPANLTLDLPPMPIADAFAQKPLLTQTNGIGFADNLAATHEDSAGEPRHADQRGGRSLWLTWRAPTSGVATFSTVGSSFDTLLAIYTGPGLAALQTIASDDDSGGFLTSEVRFNAVAGTEYHVAVDGFALAAGGVVIGWDLDPSVPPLPVISEQPRDLLGVVGDPARFTVAFTPANAGVQWLFNGRVLAGQTAATLLLGTITPAHAGTYQARLQTPEGAVLDSATALLDVVDRPQAGAAPSADKLEELFADDEPGAGASAGAAALVRSSTIITPAADLPVSIGLPGSQWTDNSQSSRGTEDPELCEAMATATRWFRLRFNVPGGGPTTVRLTTEGTGFPSLVAVYTNRTRLRMVACDAAQPPGKPAAAVQFGALRGVDYLVLVDGLRGARGPIRLNWTGEEEAPPQVSLRDGRFHVEMRVAPALYEWQSADALGVWRTLFSTNPPSGVFEFHDDLPAGEPARFFRLIPANR